MKRCAIYTRKSSEEGLDQQFNSLDAQREACDAYVLSQAGEGWSALPGQYDDGGYSGGSMDRPALRRLLADIGKGLVDVVVVYKIDRLTRSLADFARIVEQFDAHGVSFVSVTQAFNTTSSMGRLTLNVLLSFAQFEREVTGERIRDKIAASKAKGMWMGGLPPLGYDAPATSERILRVNQEEAATVRSIFERYLELGSVHKLVQDLEARGIHSKERAYANGRVTGGQPFSRGALFHLLRNRVYLGEIVHKGDAYAGLHEAIVERAMFDAVQRMLNEHRRQRTSRSHQAAPLVGKLFLADGRRLTPTHSRGARGKAYRYYTPASRQTGPKRRSEVRLPSDRFETQLRALLQRIAPAGADALGVATRIELHSHQLLIDLPAALGATVRRSLAADEQCELIDQNIVRWTIPWTWPQRGCATIGQSRSAARRDRVLIKALRSAHAMLDHDRKGRPLLLMVPRPRYQRRLARLAFLSPGIQEAILEGRQPPGLALEHLVRNPLPLAWDEQERFIARMAAS
jgi:DNA invertase Pin-like site-specific DNA recombinase